MKNKIGPPALAFDWLVLLRGVPGGLACPMSPQCVRLDRKLLSGSNAWLVVDTAVQVALPGALLSSPLSTCDTPAELS